MKRFLKIIGAVAIINIIARLFGFLREVIIGIQFGTTDMSDSIINAYTIPNFLYLVIGGAFTTAFISIYHKTKSSIRDYISRTFTTIVVSMAVITLIFMVFDDFILHAYFRDLTDREFELLKSLYQWMMPSTIMLVLSTWLSGILNVQGKFHLSSFSVLVYNLSFLVISVGLSFFIGPIGYGIGALIGAIFMIGFLIFGVRKLENMSFKPSFSLADDQKELWKVSLPIMLGGATAQMYVLLQRFFTNFLDAGAVSAMNYATKVSQFPQAILMTAVTTVIYPLLSKKEGEGDEESVKALYIRGLRMLFLLVMPISMYFFFQSEVIVKIIFEYGKFNEESTAYTAPLLQIFSLTMFFLAANTYITRFYYAKGNSMTPVIFSLITVFGVNIAVTYALIGNLGAEAVAWGNLISAVINFILLVAYLQGKYKLNIVKSNLFQFVKFGVLTVAFVVVAWLISKFIVIDYKWIHFFVTLLLSLASYGVLVYLLKFQEVNGTIGKLKNKLLKSNK
ncbi:murein biosynthesis integral membrane protein MurJ [Lysinibacillus telephonicus]|uniref:Lipid II flippase n=1 Tax=Lysinibacillus telephonicus TaxID=1714840 RepID=A0A431UUY1_9BACI|nr:murein biosynthesis integral membrane protein MurJ [Lysinibacillus telephonicus]RTQ94343.1 murein biosynthesis integral membrane protein MurJ [Lysinibacillus telephonicus]